MAISSVLNPQNIIGNRQGTAEQFQNFITGGNGSLGSSIVNSTSSNKIVPFERGGVRPITPNFNSIISNISTKTDTVLDTNIKNQENKVQGVVNNIQNVFQTTLQNFTKGYQENLKKIEDSKPSGILEKFFGLYNNVTGFIQFFGDRKNLNKISSSLKGLRGLFEDSFETAKLIRKTINKIVKQLSSLPVASPSGGGGFNLDIKVPGSPLKNAAGKMLGGGRGKMLALGAGALGTGMLAGGAINALTGSEDIQPAVVQQSIPENLADSLSSIVDRFVNAIDELIKGASQKPKTTPSTSGGGGGGGGAPAPSPSPGPPGGGGAIIPGDAPPEIKALMETISGGEGGPNSVQGIGEVKGLSDMTIDQAISTAKSHIGRGSETGALGAYQFHSEFLRGRAVDAGFDPARDKFNLENQTKIMRHFQTVVYGGSEEKLVESLRSGGLESDVFPKLSKNFGWPSLPGGSQQNVHTPGSAKRYRENLKKYQTISPSIQTPQVAPAPTQTKANAATISQPVKPQANITTLSIPAEVSSVGGQSQGGGGGGGVSAPPPPSGGSPSVPFLPAGNVDNFLVLYSKMVYNIVDG
jgi:hypothetical protein